MQNVTQMYSDKVVRHAIYTTQPALVVPPYIHRATSIAAIQTFEAPRQACSIDDDRKHDYDAHRAPDGRAGLWERERAVR